MPIPSGNAILHSLPAEEFDRLAPYLRSVRLTPGQRLCSVEEPLGGVWFPQTGAASRVIQLLSGETVEAGFVGHDGVIGLPLVLGGLHSVGQCTVQVEGVAFAMSASDFQEQVRERGGPLLDALLLYANLYLTTLGQLTACHCLHRIEQRLSRCILMLSDYSTLDQIRVTHDTLAEFLGVHRPSITYALQALVGEGAIVSERRRIVIADRKILLDHVCECYNVIRNATAREIGRMRSLLAS